MNANALVMEQKKETVKQSQRIQTSVLNAAEKKALVWMGERMPRWVSSDMMTSIGTIGAVVIALGYALSGKNINFLWLASLGFVLNWFGDSLDGTIARVRNQQRPKYGFFIDHTVDVVNETLMFIGMGLSPLMDFDIAMMILAAYLMLSVYVYISAHLKGEFKLTYAKMGPTELRIIAVIMNTLFVLIRPLREFSAHIRLFGKDLNLGVLDIAGIIIVIALLGAYFVSIFHDAKIYAKEEPLPKRDQ